MPISIGYRYCILVILTVSQRHVTGPEPVCLESNLPLPLWVLSTILTLAGGAVSDVQLVGLGQWEALVRQWRIGRREEPGHFSPCSLRVSYSLTHAKHAHCGSSVWSPLFSPVADMRVAFCLIPVSALLHHVKFNISSI